MNNFDGFKCNIGTTFYNYLQGELNLMQGVLPTITKFGMAALLPHEQLEYSADGTIKVP